MASLPEKIQKLEAEQEKLYAAMADPASYQKNSKEMAQTKSRSEAIAEELVKLYHRWEHLEGLEKGAP